VSAAGNNVPITFSTGTNQPKEDKEVGVASAGAQ
jgi:hypothetical protein